MNPVVIASPGGDCFAMYGSAPGPAVLFCPSFGDEALKTARIWRNLAVRLGDRGFATLRFDLPGTGNSAGEATDPDRVDAWRAAVKSCAAWLDKRHDGHVILLGYRFGALLALDAVGSAVKADRLVLLDPPISGTAWVRYLRARAAMAQNAISPEKTGDINVGGIPLSAATLGMLAELPRPMTGTDGPPALLVINDTTSTTSPWPTRLGRHGSDVETIPFEGYSQFASHDAFRAKPPRAVLDKVVDYLTCSLDPLSPPDFIAPLASSELFTAGCVETAVRFGADRKLFGILCRPEVPVATAIALLLPSTGADPCSGMSRMWTELARRLARQGVTSLRFDMSGVGESEGDLGHNPLSAMYHTDRVTDLRAAVDHLTSLGFPDVSVVAYCAGAYAAWHAAVPDLRIAAIFAGNLLFLNAQPTLAEDVLQSRPGSSQIGQRSTVMGRLLPARGIAVLRRLDNKTRRIVPKPIRNILRSWERDPQETRRHVKSLVARGCSIRLVMANDDHGHVRLRRAYGDKPRLPKGVELTVIPGADHQFSDRHHRTQFLDLAANFALQRLAKTHSAVSPR